MRVRRLVTGHDADGKAKVLIDEVCHGEYRRPGATAQVIWSTQGFPVVQDEDEDRSIGIKTTTVGNGTVFRISEYQPGVSARVHRTDTIDYAIVLKGKIILDVEGHESALTEGDVVVQRGTVHNWINRSGAPCLLAFVLISAKPVAVNGRQLKAMG